MKKLPDFVKWLIIAGVLAAMAAMMRLLFSQPDLVCTVTFFRICGYFVMIPASSDKGFWRVFMIDSSCTAVNRPSPVVL